MTEIKVKAYAKINLSLDILGKRPDGYHEMSTVMQSVDLCDDITIVTGTGRLDRVQTNLNFLPSDARNLALAAARDYFNEINVDPGGILISMKKRIPVSAGMGGGSADAAAVLRGLSSTFEPLPDEKLLTLASRLGADVPFCLYGGTALGLGTGDRLQRLPDIPDCYIAVCRPNFPISTRRMFELIDGIRIRQRPDTAGLMQAVNDGDIGMISRYMFNVFEPLLRERHRELALISDILLEWGALGAVMSGSGPTMFGIFDSREPAEEALSRLSQEGFFTALTRPVGNLKD